MDTHGRRPPYPRPDRKNPAVKWILTHPILAWDTETTGVNTETDRIVSATTVYIDPTHTPARTTIHTWLINPGIPIPPGATQVHGITDEHVQAHGVDPVLGLEEIAATLNVHIGTPWVAYNTAYDTTILDRELRRHGLPPVYGQGQAPSWVVDPYVLDRHLDPYRSGTRRLSAEEGGLCEWYDVRMGGAHDATHDAVAAGRLAWRLASMTQWPRERLIVHFQGPGARRHNPRRHDPQGIADRFVALANVSPAELHALQVGWKAEQAAGLREHFIREGKSVSDIHEAWPLVPYKETS